MEAEIADTQTANWLLGVWVRRRVRNDAAEVELPQQAFSGRREPARMARFTYDRTLESLSQVREKLRRYLLIQRQARRKLDE